MPSATTFLAFSAVALALIVVPGPGVLFVVARSITNGRVGGVISVLGVALGGIVPVVAVACGLGAILVASETVFTVVKLLGAVYLIILGVQTIRRRRQHSAVGSTARAPGRILLRQGFVVGASNPKTAVFFAAVLPQFVDYRSGAVPEQLAALGVAFLLLALASDSVWALASGTARSWFARSPRRTEQLDLAGGVTMIGLGGVLAAQERLG